MPRFAADCSPCDCLLLLEIHSNDCVFTGQSDVRKFSVGGKGHTTRFITDGERGVVSSLGGAMSSSVTESESQLVTMARFPSPETATVIGFWPTDTSAVTLPAARSTKDAVFDVVFAVTAQRPSGVKAKSDGERLGVDAITDPHQAISITAAIM